MIRIGKIAPKAPVALWVLTWMLVAAFGVTVTILFLGEYARKEDVIGRIVTRDLVRLSAERAGYVTDIAVKLGDKVKKGQPLLSVKPAVADSINHASNEPSSALHIARLETLLQENTRETQRAKESETTQQQLVQLQIRQHERNLALANKVQVSIKRRMAIADNQRRKHEKMAAAGAVSASALQDATVRYETLVQEAANNEANINSYRQRVLELTQRADEIRQSTIQSQNQLAQLRNDLLERLDSARQSQEYVLMSPVDGVVDTVSSYAGDKVDENRVLMMIRTSARQSSRASVLLDVKPSAVGFVRPGKEVIVRIDAFPYERYGVLRAHVVSDASGTLVASPAGIVRKDSDTPAYLVEAALDLADSRADIDPAWLKDGMTVSASMKLQKMTLMEWLFLPVVKAYKRNPDFL